jgi:membrane protease YdiL (CAAX protease family)
MSTRKRDRGPDAVTGRRLLLTLALWILLAVAAGAATWTLSTSLAPGWSGATDGPVLLIVAEAYLALLLALALAFGGYAGLRDRLRFRLTSGRDLLFALGAWVLCCALTALAYVALTPVLGPPREALDELALFGSDYGRLYAAGPLAMALILPRACLLAPLCEELLFRGALFGWFRQRFPSLPTILLTAVLFAAIHAAGTVLLLPFALFFGATAAWVRERTGSVLPSFVMHAANNVSMVVLAYALAGWSPTG